MSDRKDTTRGWEARGSEGERWTQLLLRAQKGDEGAFGQLIEVAEREIWVMAFMLLGDEFLADRVVTETFGKVWEKMHDYDPARGASARTWIHTIAERRARDFRRGLRRRDDREVAGLGECGEGEDAGQVDPPDTTEIAPHEGADLGYRAKVVRKALGQLREDDRRILVLYHLDDLDYEAIALEMGLSAKAIGSRLTRARQAFLELLRDEEL